MLTWLLTLYGVLTGLYISDMSEFYFKTRLACGLALKRFGIEEFEGSALLVVKRSFLDDEFIR